MSSKFSPLTSTIQTVAPVLQCHLRDSTSVYGILTRNQPGRDPTKVRALP